MITSSTSNPALYTELFNEATEILGGYIRAKNYDEAITTYYYKDINANTFAEKFVALEGIVDWQSFAAQLQKYSILYKQITPAEHFDPDTGITTLEEYFGWIKELSEIGKDDENPYGRKFTMLPLDEPHFIIDTNSRAITIPAEFKKSGVAVQGDNMAEIVWFKVPRYFDYKDLNESEIFIQWETPKAGNVESVKHVSVAYYRDIESQPGYLIFGWVISDAITAAAGTLKFSIRFFEWTGEDKTKVDYSLSTLTATVSIQPSINLNIPGDLKGEPDDPSAILLERITDGEVLGVVPAATPTFIINLISNEAGYDLVDGEYPLEVLAKVTDTGALKYSWYRRNLTQDNESTRDQADSVDSEIIFKEIADKTEAVYDTNYYYGDSVDNAIQYYNQKDIASNWDRLKEEGKHIYIRVSKALATQVGEYWVVVTNRLSNSARTANSDSVIFPYPIKAIITKDLEKKLILSDIDQELVVEAKNEHNNDSTLTYQWYSLDNAEQDLAPDYIADNAAPIAEATGKTYIPATAGYYLVEINNIRNGADNPVKSSACRVTELPAAPVIIALEPGASEVDQDFLMDGSKILYAEIDPADILSDGYLAAWFFKPDLDEEFEIQMTDYIEMVDNRTEFNPTLPEYIEKLGENYHLVGGNYFARVGNYLNGEMTTADSDAFTISY